MMARIPNFRGQRALVLHHADRNCAAIVEQLERLGVVVSVQWPVTRTPAQDADFVFFDSDLGFDEMFAWEPGMASVPLVAILGSEAPGRIEWTMAQEPSAYVMKPVGSTGIFSVLSIAFHSFVLKRDRAELIHRTEERLQLRGTVLRAALSLMKRLDIGDEDALRLLRTEAMRRRVTLEAVSSLALEGLWIAPRAKRGKPPPRQAGKRANSI